MRRIGLSVVVVMTMVATTAGTPLPSVAQPTPSCQGQPATVVGTEGPDRLVGTPGPDVIAGLGGDDIIWGRSGDDIVCGDDGDDWLFGNRGDDVLVGGSGTDRLLGRGGSDTLLGGSGPDRLLGGQGDDQLDGQGGDDELRGQRGDDVLTGGDGTDKLVGGRGQDTCSSGEDVTGCETVDPGGSIEIDPVPAETDRASITVSGQGPPSAFLVVTGGVLPSYTGTDEDGAFSVEVWLAGEETNMLTVEVAAGDPATAASFEVGQQATAATGVVSGSVISHSSEEPISGVSVSYGKATTITEADGSFQLEGVPDGQVMFRVGGDDQHLASVGLVQVQDGQGSALPARLTRLVPGQEIGSGGGVIEGEGWRVEVPPGALAEPTVIQATPLEVSGPTAVLGTPIVDLSPTGQTFEEPVVVTIDPEAYGLSAEGMDLIGLDPDSLTIQELDERVDGQQVTVELTTFRGQELWTRPDSRWDDWGGAAAACISFDNDAQALDAQIFLSTWLLPYLRFVYSSTSFEFYSRYITPGVPDTTRVSANAAADEFRDSPWTEQGVERVLRRVAGTDLPPLRDPASPATFQVEAQDPNGGRQPINYNSGKTTPVNIAGGLSTVNIEGQIFSDDRFFTGPVEVTPEADARGVLERVEFVANLELEVLDSIDFCRGGTTEPDGLGSVKEQQATIALSRLEVTPHPSGGNWATPFLWDMQTELDEATLDVSNRYPTNDPDRDTWPDTQPWIGGTFTLDNCPGTANEDQADSDGDGIGDACDEEEPPPDPGPRPPKPGTSYGHPNLITFDGLRYVFHGAGDYVFAESTTDDFEVQARYSRLGNMTSVSFNRAVAARVGGSTITFGDDDTSTAFDRTVVRLDDQVIDLAPGATQTLPGGAELRSPVGVLDLWAVEWPDGTVLEVGQEIGQNFTLQLSEARWTAMQGLLGDADGDPTNDLVDAVGAPVDPYEFDDYYDRFGGAWRVDPANSLFASELDPGDIEPIVPEAEINLADLPADARAEGERVCRAAGVTPLAGLAECIFDVAMTGESRWTTGVLAVADLVADSVAAAAITQQFEDEVVLTGGGVVTGQLTEPYAVDAYTIDLERGSAIRITTSTCSEDESFVVVLLAPSGRIVGRTQGDGCGSLHLGALIESGDHRLHVLDAAGFTGSYEFEVTVSASTAECVADQSIEIDRGREMTRIPIDLPFTIGWDGHRFSRVWIHENGVLGFDGAFPLITPRPADELQASLAYVFWADADVPGPNLIGDVRYGTGRFEGNRAFCVLWESVGYHENGFDRANTFQAFIVERPDIIDVDFAFDLVYEYDTIQWETGDRSGGTDGLGGTSATVGWNFVGYAPFREVASFERQGSLVPGSFLDGGSQALATSSTNSDVPGRHVFEIRLPAAVSATEPGSGPR